jgi:hypothetical protein
MRNRSCFLSLPILLALVLAFPATAFDVSARSDNQLFTESALRARVLEIAAEVGHNIPDDPRVRVAVYSRALESQFEGAMIYLHRVQLTKAFRSTPPYPFAGYLPLRSVERYGVDDEAGMREKFDEALRAFFTQMKEMKPEGSEPTPPPVETIVESADDDE